ncbi:recombinase RecA [Paraclostridium sordellii 8483]|uniref:recombinase RecA n=1 Tax=Paraclostridium sordellii TaxID=1505 RepID=UPI0002FE07A0|nr:recombinase RecA [Paeniclostridium sordellii]TAN67679.1 recombinase RecA [Paeniclostridium sordellii 8483]
MAKENKYNVEQITDVEGRKKALDDALKQIEKDFGQGSVMKLGDKSKLEIDTLSTGSLSIDLAVGIGGLPKGRIVEIYGPESSGKTTVTLHAVAEAQKNGGIAAFIDAEHALDPIYAKAIGVDVDNLIVSQPDTGEQALEIAEALIRSGAIDLIVVDSVAALVPKAEIEGDMGDSHVGLHARLMSQALRKLTGSIKKSNCVAIFINQLREKVGVMFGSPETTTGGRALKFYSSVRLDVRKIDTIKQGDKVFGSRTRVKVVKNKVAPPFTQCEFDIMYGEGISKTGEVLDIATDKEIVKKSGAWYSYNETKLGQGREKVKQFLDDNKDLLEEIEQKVREMCVIKPKGKDEEVESENIENSNVDTEKNENKTENVKENNTSSINQTGTDRIV